MEKKYKVGYMAGVYDLFHIGHLNLITSAKRYCDYLMVGVLEDAEVIRWKKNPPFVPFEERFQIIALLKDVDEVIKVTSANIARLESWNRYRFDCQFSGSDYANDPGWLKDREELQKRGSDLVFLPYTESTSSTKLKALIERRLI
ncbi:MAG: adenylyltransferase/cytidyltransferase family protein [Eubacterium sp.]|nr:adenylyltransferase/cytidyltransferase family protein [Eubacterium sp.]